MERMVNDKIGCMEIARKFGFDYWDGDRKYGFGGYKYQQGRWKKMAEDIISVYNLSNKSSMLDVGCGKSFLLYEIQLLLPDIQITGLDISKYALEHSHPEFKGKLIEHDARTKLPFNDLEFDLVISINTLHNFYLPKLVIALSEMERVSSQKYLVVEAYRNLTEFFNVQCWALTAPTLITPEEWEWLFQISGYSGDYEFIYFE
jgi:ubiquinone/menaquinone biosynthesis C-methylase UbiE